MATSSYRVHPSMLEVDDSLSSDIWGTLPDSVIEQILAKLPFSVLFRLCCVCKSWRQAILNSQVSPRCTSAQVRPLYFHAGQLTIFNPSRGVWDSVPLPFLHDQVDRLSSLSLIASAGGLLCLNTSVFGKFIICNPVTKCYNILQIPIGEPLPNSEEPCMPTPSIPKVSFPAFSNTFEGLLVGMVLDMATGYFNLVVGACFVKSQNTALVYNSGTASWKKVANVPKGVSLGMEPTACNGNLYWSLLWRRQSPEERLLMYNVEQQTWRWIHFNRQSVLTRELREVLTDEPFCILIARPEILRQLFTWKLIEHNGKLLLMTRHLNRRYHFVFVELTDTGFTLWESANLPDLTALSEVLTPKPNNSFSMDNTNVECLGEGNAMCFIVKDYFKNLESSSLASTASSSASYRGWDLRLRVMIHDFSTNSDILSDWEEWHLGAFPPPDCCSIYKPSFLRCN